MGSALMGPLQNFMSFDRGTSWVLPLTYFCPQPSRRRRAPRRDAGLEAAAAAEGRAGRRPRRLRRWARARAGAAGRGLRGRRAGCRVELGRGPRRHRAADRRLPGGWESPSMKVSWKVVYRSFCLYSSTVAVSKITSRRRREAPPRRRATTPGCRARCCRRASRRA